jgi:HEAT repeat protein
MSRDLLDQIISHALAEPRDDDAYWEAVRALQKCDVQEVWDLVEPLSRDGNPCLRAVAPDVLRYLDGPALPLAERTVALFRKMLRTEDAPIVISSIGGAFIDLSRCDERVELMLPFVHHPASEARLAVVHAVLASRDPAAIAALIFLTRDVDDDVRNWATFGIGSQLGMPDDDVARDGAMVDSRELRDALANRLDDAHDETRCEALVGLAMRHDMRALPVLKKEILDGPRFALVLDAARWMASPDLCEPLRSLTKSTDADALKFWNDSGLEDAIAACCASEHPLPAVRMAMQEGLDLVEVNPNASPPEFKLLDFSKYKYDAARTRARAKERATDREADSEEDVDKEVPEIAWHPFECDGRELEYRVVPTKSKERPADWPANKPSPGEWRPELSLTVRLRGTTNGGFGRTYPIDATVALDEAIDTARRFRDYVRWSGRLGSRELLDLVTRVMSALLAGEDPIATALRHQYEQADIEGVDLTGSGVYVRFSVPEQLPRIDRNFIGCDAVLAVDGLEHGAGCLVAIDGGALRFLECYVNGEQPWPDRPRLISIEQVLAVSEAMGGETLT